ncbi:MAG: hypothetical protein HFH68_02500 [Lachnospiraceae bacterium]|nr:hypothetical protein [Lachnospiraceae bacterium]
MIPALNNFTMPQGINNYTQQDFKPETSYIDKPENPISDSFLGNSMIGNICLSAEYSDKSSYNNPVISVTMKSNDILEKIDININSVNPENATSIEMFAFCKYTESKLPDSPMFFAAWEKLTQFQEIAEKNNMFEPAYNTTDCKNIKKDWDSMVNNVNNILMKEGDYNQLITGKKLEGIFSGDIGKCSTKYQVCGMKIHYDKEEIVEDIGIWNLPGHIDLMFSSTREIVCIDQNSSVILWSLSLSEEEADLSRSFFSLPETEIYKPYVADINFWKSYFDGSLDLNRLDEFNKIVEDKNQNNSFNENCPDEVKHAWDTAEELSGFNPFGIFADGKIEYFSEYLKQMLINFLLGTDTNVLGNTKEQAYEFAQTAINSIEKNNYNSYYTEIKNNEKEFWKIFLANL